MDCVRGGADRRVLHLDGPDVEGVEAEHINTHSHDALDMCLMSYDNQDNGVTEFSKACILDGSSINGNDSLRKRVDD